MLVDLWLIDAELGSMVAGVWMSDGATRNEGLALSTLNDLALKDIELAREMSGFSWLADSIDKHELNAIVFLNHLAANEIELAGEIVRLMWFADDVTEEEVNAVEHLNDLVSWDVELAGKIVERTWFADGVTEEEVNAVEHLNDLASKDVKLAVKVSAVSWLADDVTKDESLALRSFDTLATVDIEVARNISGSPWFADSGTLASNVSFSLIFLALPGVDAFGELTDQPWFADGLDKEEAAFVITLWSCSALGIPDFYTDLLRTHYTKHRAVSLPLAGEVNIWIFQNTPFPPDGDLLTVVEETARISEGFFGVPFPTTDIILLVADDEHGLSARYVDSHIVATRGPDGVRSVPHEISHYYLHSGPKWLDEGISQFIQTYVNDQIGVQSIVDRGAEVFHRVQFDCFDSNEIENILHHVYIWDQTAFSHGSCLYDLSENFLLNVFETIGERAMVSALRELYPLVVDTYSYRWEDILEVEKLIFDTFKKHTPADRLEEFLDLYHRLHGGPYAYPVIDPMDDHANDASTATEIAVGEIVEGSLDYYFDLDYFKFRADEGLRYLISVDHEGLRSTSVFLYGPDGATREQLVDRWKNTGHATCGSFPGPKRESKGTQMRWIAPRSSDYYIPVNSFAGSSGRYTIEITPVTTISDDHGDSPATASNLAVDRMIEGVVDYDFDLDFFLLKAVAGRKYKFSVETDSDSFVVDVHMYTSDGFKVTRRLASAYRGERNSPSYEWVAPNSGEYYLAANGDCGTIGTYRLFISEAESD